MREPAPAQKHDAAVYVCRGMYSTRSGRHADPKKEGVRPAGETVGTATLCVSHLWLSLFHKI